MADSNAFLVRPVMSKWYELRAIIATDFDALDLDHQIYAPERFVLGHFKERKDGFKLSRDRIFYRDSSEALSQFKKFLDDEKIEVVRPLFLPEVYLERITQQGKIYADAEKQLSGAVQSVESFFV